ncbi:MAG: type ISP restriction/modification enzyme [Oligoflexia bacterium]
MGTPAARRLSNDSPFAEYTKELKTKFRNGNATEHTYRGALQDFIKAMGTKLQVINEPKRIECGAPDYIITRSNVPIGYVEAKDIDESLDKVEKSDQLKRYFESLSNLILTDYLEFRWYVNGEKRLAVRIGETKGGSINFLEGADEKLEALFQGFLNAEIPTIQSAQELAERLAGTTRSIRELIVQAFNYEEAKKGWLHRWLNAFCEVLIHDLDKETFADMFAQTLAYGFFAAKVHHTAKAEFSRFAAANILPKTNPFLRQLFAQFAGMDMPETISWAVDEIIELLKRADMGKVLKDFNTTSGKNDPVVHFYETFLTAYNPELREKRGVYYTPAPVVDYITRSVDEILQHDFGKKAGLADDQTLILDPAVGTASFLHNVVERIYSRFSKNRGMWDSYVAENLLGRVFGFEILMAPYAVSHLKLGLQLQDTGYKFQRDQRLGVFLTNTLEEAAKKSQEMMFDWISDEANAASSIKKDKPIMVVLGNPPYSGESANKGKWIADLMRGYDSITGTKTGNYFECEGKPLGERNPKWLNDDYVKFIRFAQWRIEQTKHGILAFVTNHGFLENPTFRGMRENLMKTFDEIYVLDLHGNSKKKEIAPNGKPDQNVFDIQQGVSINFFIRRETSQKERTAKVYRYDVWGTRDEKYAWLNDHSKSETPWKELKPKSPNFLFSQSNEKINEEYSSGWSLPEIFTVNSVGIATARDSLCVQFNEDAVESTVKSFMGMSKEEAREEFALGKDAHDWSIEMAQKDLRAEKFSKEKIVPILYRPFDKRFTYYTGNSRGFHCRPRKEVMTSMISGNNIALCSTRSTETGAWEHLFCTDSIISLHTVSIKEVNYIYPLYVYEQAEDHDDFFKKVGTRSSNMSAAFSATVESQLKAAPTEREVFNYIYAVLSSAGYRTRYRDQLKSQYPRVPITNDKRLFSKLAELGADLVEAHLRKKAGGRASEFSFPVKGDCCVEYVKYDTERRRVFINDNQYFEGISEEIWLYSVGGFQISEKWLKDRKGSKLKLSEIRDYQANLAAIEISLKKVEQIDNAIKNAGGWPLQGSKAASPNSPAASKQIALVKSKAEKEREKLPIRRRKEKSA